MDKKQMKQISSLCAAETYPGWEYTDEEREFLMAIERYKRVERKPFPTWVEALGVLRELGWRKGGETRRQGDKETGRQGDVVAD